MNMEKRSGDQTGTRRIRVYLWVWVVLWSTTVAGLLASDIRHIRSSSLDMALSEARIQLNRDQATRLWVASHGGVYVPIRETTPTNPRLGHVPERDIVTPSGRPLTLMNPSYVLREMTDQYSGMYGISGHITSLSDLSAETAPDDWERNCLLAFEQGREEVWEICDMKDGAHLRLMRPMYVARDCLGCHGYQGYRVGEAWGGLSVSVPMAGYLRRQGKETLAHAVSFLILWIAGVSVIGFTARGLIRRTRERDQVDAQLRSTEKELRLVSTRLLNSWEEERKRVAHEVHEGLAQTMSAIKFRVESALACVAERESRQDAGSLSGHLEPIIAIVQDGVCDIRRMASRLRPMMLDDMGILPTIGWLCREVEKNHPSFQIGTRLDIEEGQIPESLKVVIYRILENGLGLLAKDGHRGSVEISLVYESGGIDLIVQTDGDVSAMQEGFSGSEAQEAPSLSTMKELAILSGGSFSMSAGEEGGSALHVSWPPQARS
jgi:signal transduction histidine kinase